MTIANLLAAMVPWVTTDRAGMGSDETIAAAFMAKNAIPADAIVAVPLVEVPPIGGLRSGVVVPIREGEELHPGAGGFA